MVVPNHRTNPQGPPVKGRRPSQSQDKDYASVKHDLAPGEIQAALLHALDRYHHYYARVRGTVAAASLQTSQTGLRHMADTISGWGDRLAADHADILALITIYVRRLEDLSRAAPPSSGI